MLVFYIALIASLTVEGAVKDPCLLADQLTWRPCSQICNPMNESYTCSCIDGYTLAQDERTCNTIDFAEPGMFYIANSRIEVYVPNQDQLQIVHDNAGNVTDFVFGPNRTLLWTDMYGQMVFMLKFDENFIADMEEVVVDTGLLSPNGLAVDWSAAVIYIVDTKPGEIIVCSLKGDNCAVLLQDLKNPQEIVIEPNERILFWSAWGDTVWEGGIYQCGTDGSSSGPLVKGIPRPRGLLLDRPMRTLFWLSGAGGDDTYVVQMFDLEKRYKVDVFTFHTLGSSPSFFLFKSSLYINDGDKIAMAKDFLGDKEGAMPLDMINSEGPVKLYQPVLYQAKGSVSQCKTSQCSHLCVHSNSHQGYQCLCPLDMELVSKVSCRRNDEIRLLTSGFKKFGIHEVPLQFIGLSTSRPCPLVIADIGCFTYGPANQIIVYHLGNRIELVPVHHTSNVTVLYSDVPSVEGMALDEAAGHLYWSSRKGHITRGELGGSVVETIVTGLDRPRGIAVDTTHRHLYVCDWGMNAGIVRCSTEGRNCETLVPIPNGHPNNIIINSYLGSDEQRLIWTDSNLEYIGLVSLDSNGTEEKITLDGTQNPHPYAIAAAGPTVYFTDLNTGFIHYFQIDHDPTEVHDLALGLGPLYGIEVFRYQHSNDLSSSVPVLAETNSSMPNMDSRTMPTGNFDPAVLPAAVIQEPDYIWVVFVIVGIVLAALLVTASICYYRNRQKQNLLNGFIRYVKANPSEDIEHLMAHSASSNASFQNMEDLDYPDWEARSRSNSLQTSYCAREYSTVSIDSAFTEMQDYRHNSVDSMY